MSLRLKITRAVCGVFALMSGIAHAAPDLGRFLDAAASDPKTMGWMIGSPPPDDKLIRYADGDFLVFPKLRWAVNHTQELLPTATVWRGTAKAASLPRTERALDTLRFTDADNVSRTWAQALDKTWTDGVIVLHKGRVVYEKYKGGSEPQRQHLLFSCTKSFVGTLAALLAHEKRLDPGALVTRYVPELAHSAWGDATVRQVMDMTVGVQYSENYADPKAGVWAYLAAGGLTPPRADSPASFTDYLRSVPKEGEHGQAFAYKTPNTDVLAWIVQRAGGKPLAQQLSERFWQKLGVEEDAYILLDRTGFASGGGGLNTTLRDFARFGEMMRQGGKYNGQQIVPASVVADIMGGADKTSFAKAGYATLPNWSYRSMWWVSDAGYIMARGIHGQALYIDPANDVVIARFGSHPISAHTVQDPIMLPAYRAVAAYLTATP
jgi:CubicO group peptidase (beta-lactamase class C family)